MSCSADLLPSAPLLLTLVMESVQKTGCGKECSYGVYLGLFVIDGICPKDWMWEGMQLWCLPWLTCYAGPEMVYMT